MLINYTVQWLLANIGSLSSENSSSWMVISATICQIGWFILLLVVFFYQLFGSFDLLIMFPLHGAFFNINCFICSHVILLELHYNIL